MKRFLFFLSLFFCAVIAMQAEEPWAEIRFDKTVHKFGTFTRSNAEQTCVFTFKNTGKAPLVVFQAIASCGCTVPKYPEEPIMPGKTGKIEVMYNGKYRAVGYFKRTVTILTNAKNKKTILAIEGTMIEDEENKDQN